MRRWTEGVHMGGAKDQRYFTNAVLRVQVIRRHHRTQVAQRRPGCHTQVKEV